MRPLLLIAALVVAALALCLGVLARGIADQTAQIVTLSERVTAVEDSVSRIRPLQASHNALARRVNRLNKQAGRVFSTKPQGEK